MVGTNKHNKCAKIRAISYQADVMYFAQRELKMNGEIDFNEVYEKFQPKILHYLSRLAGCWSRIRVAGDKAA